MLHNKLNNSITRNSIINVLFIGAESCGKTTTALHMRDMFDAIYSSEWLRVNYEHAMHIRNTCGSTEFLNSIIQGQNDFYNNAVQLARDQKKKFVLHDTDNRLTHIYADYFKLKPSLPCVMNHYDIVFVFNHDHEYIQDGIRDAYEARATVTENCKRYFLDNDKYSISRFIQGNRDERLAQVRDTLLSCVKVVFIFYLVC